MRFTLSRLCIVTLALGVAATGLAQQTTDSGGLAGLLPTAPSGWDSADGEAVEGQAMGIDVAQVSRIFTNADGTRVEVVYIGSPSMVMASRSAGMMFQNPTMLNQMNASNPDKQFAAIDNEGWGGWTVVDGEAGESEATAFNEELVVKITVNQADGDLLATFLDLVPWTDLGALNQ